MFIDTHCHLQDEKYNGQSITEIIERAKNSNVKIIIVSGYDEKSNIKAVEIANAFAEVYATVGYHPEEAENIKDDNLQKLELISKNEKVLAIGEIGLDYHYDNINIDKQKELFVKQLQLANKIGKPVVVHSRDSINDTYNILKNYKSRDTKGVLHCYASSYEMAKEFIKLNMIFGVGGVVTYKNSEVLKDVVKNVDIQYLVLETDAPYLSPEPKRGQVNEPANIPYVANKIAEIKGIDINEVMEKTTENARRLFDIK